jgi:hypothetical protein
VGDEAVTEGDAVDERPIADALHEALDLDRAASPARRVE